jgi:hypothetical protein
VGVPRLDGVRAWGEMDLSVGTRRLDGVLALGLHRHIIALEWDNVTLVTVGENPCEGNVMRGSATPGRRQSVGAPRLGGVRARG